MLTDGPRLSPGLRHFWINLIDISSSANPTRLLCALLQPMSSVEHHGSVFAIADPQLLGTRQTRQRNLARRRFPGSGMRLLPTELPPSRSRVEGRPAIVADAEKSGRICTEF